MVPTSSVRAGDILRVLPGAEQRLTKATRKVVLPDIVLLFACVHPPLLHGGACCRMPTVSSRNTPACFTNNNTTLHPLAPLPSHTLLCMYVCICSWWTHAGERVPCDGEVIEGTAAADESMLTGESIPVPKSPGDALAGGTVVWEAPLTLRATATGAESTLAGVCARVCACVCEQHLCGAHTLHTVLSFNAVLCLNRCRHWEAGGCCSVA